MPIPACRPRCRGRRARTRVLRVPDDAGSQRVDRFVADVTGPVAEPRPEAHHRRPPDGGRACRSRRTRVIGPGTALRLVVPAAEPLDLAPAPEIAAPRRLRGRRPADRRQAGRPRRPPVAGPRRRDARQRAPRPRRGWRLRRDRRRPAAGHRPSPRPRHERAADGREARRRPALADGPAQGAPGQEDVPRARPRGGLRPPSAGSRRRSGATRSTGPGWPSSPTAGRRRPAIGSASGSPAGRSSSSTS